MKTFPTSKLHTHSSSDWRVERSDFLFFFFHFNYICIVYKEYSFSFMYAPSVYNFSSTSPPHLHPPRCLTHVTLELQCLFKDLLIQIYWSVMMKRLPLLFFFAVVSCYSKHYLELICAWCCSIGSPWSYMILLRSQRKNIALWKGRHRSSLHSCTDCNISCSCKYNTAMCSHATWENRKLSSVLVLCHIKIWENNRHLQIIYRSHISFTM